VAPTEYDEIVYKAAAAIVNQARQTDRRGLTADDIQQAEQVLESSGSQETWLQQAAEFAKNHHISDKGWQGIISCFRQAFPICYPVLRRGESIPLKTECSPSLEKLCSIIPGAYQKTPEPEPPYSPCESSIERSLQRLELEEGLKDVSELQDQTFHFLFPNPSTSVHETAISSPSLSSLEEDPELAEDPPPLREKPVYSSRFNSDLNPGITREQWKANRDADLAQWEEEKAAHQELVREFLHFNIPRANYSQVWQNYYNEDYPASERSAPASPVPAEPLQPQDPPVQEQLRQEPPEEPPQEDMAANATQISRILDLMGNMKYDGVYDVSQFLRRFEGYRTRLLALDPNYDDFMIEGTLIGCLQDAQVKPRLGVDGEPYIGPASWHAKQAVADVDTYDKLREKLESKFKAKAENMSKIISRLAQLERGDKTVKEFAYEFDSVRGTVEIPDYTLVDIFTKQMPQTVIKRLLLSCPEFRDKPYEKTKNRCIKIDHAVRNPDPLENGYAKKSPKPRLADDPQVEVVRLQRQLVEKDEQISHLLKGSKRWANSADALKQDASEHRDRPSFRSRSQMVCWNCWKTGHSAAECRDIKRSDKEREALRQQLGVPASKSWEDQLQKHPSTMRAVPQRILTRKADPKDDSEDEEFDFATVRGGFSFTAREPEGTGAFDFAKMAKELEVAGVAPAGARPRARRGDPDSLFPDPVRGQKPFKELVEWFKSLKPPISMEDLLKTSPTYRREFWKYFSSNFSDEADNSEPGRIIEEGAGDQPRRRIDPIQESDSESDDEERPVEPRHRLRNRDIYMSSEQELMQELLRRFEDKLRVRHGETREEPTTVIERRVAAPSLRVAAYAAEYWVQDILVDSGAEVSLIEMRGALFIIQASPGIELRTDKSLNIKGVAGKTRTAGYLLLDLDFGQGVKAQEIVYVLPADQDLVNCMMLLSKPFLASIEAQTSVKKNPRVGSVWCVPRNTTQHTRTTKRGACALTNAHGTR
jgi:hypothetical protein